LRDELGARGRERFTDRFRHERMTHELRTLYQRILAAGQTGEMNPKGPP
jgi:hypothetical protein